MLYRKTIASPLGELTLVSDDTALLVLVMDGQKYVDRHLPADLTEGDTPVLQEAERWLTAYFSGVRMAAPSFPLSPRGTAFQQRVWAALREFPYGETLSYGQLAAALGSSARAVGTAVGRNPISILIPCHRVVGVRGSLTGYAGGLENKKRLLELEGALKP